jgi:hypothetical protein
MEQAATVDFAAWGTGKGNGCGGLAAPASLTHLIGGGAKMDDYSHTRGLNVALEAYVGALSGWRVLVEDLEREREIRGLGRRAIDTRDERLLYRVARQVVDASDVGNAPEGEGTEEITLTARRYLMEVARLDHALGEMMHHLEDVSGGNDA